MIVMFILYKAFFNPDQADEQRQPPTNPDFIPPAGTTPPPPYSDTPPPPYSSGRQRNQGNGWSWGSFATGWGASSLFNSATRGTSGGQTRYRHHSPQRNRSRSRSRSSGGGGGTRTASGFGGTSRR